MKVLLMGYSGYCQVAGFDIHLTSYSLSENNNIIKSDGASRILVGSKDEEGVITSSLTNSDDESIIAFKRMGLNVVRDYSSYDLSVSFEARYDVFKSVIKTMSETNWYSIPVNFYDNAAGVSFGFSSYLTGCDVSVENNAVAMMSLKFTSFGSVIGWNHNDYDCEKKRNAPNVLVGNCLMPYWNWYAEYDDFGSTTKIENGVSKTTPGEGLRSFGFSIQRPANPKFGCEGKKDNDNALLPMKVIMGVPSATYNLSYLMTKKISAYDSTIASNKIASNGHTLTVYYGNSIKIKFTNCYVDSYTPELANSGSPNGLNISGTVYGRISWEKI